MNGVGSRRGPISCNVVRLLFTRGTTVVVISDRIYNYFHILGPHRRRLYLENRSEHIVVMNNLNIENISKKQDFKYLRFCNRLLIYDKQYQSFL